MNTTSIRKYLIYNTESGILAKQLITELPLCLGYPYWDLTFFIKTCVSRMLSVNVMHSGLYGKYVIVTYNSVNPMIKQRCFVFATYSSDDKTEIRRYAFQRIVFWTRDLRCWLGICVELFGSQKVWPTWKVWPTHGQIRKLAFYYSALN